MNETDLKLEIAEQWLDDEGWSVDGRYEVVADLAAMSVIAWNSLASPPSGEALAAMRDIAARAGTRSVKPRIVLRTLIGRAQTEFGWQSTPSVLRAAGMKAPAA